jgi:hypothetical protein
MDVFVDIKGTEALSIFFDIGVPIITGADDVAIPFKIPRG